MPERHVAHLASMAQGSGVVVMRYRAFCSCGFASAPSERLPAGADVSLRAWVRACVRRVA